jgi:ankyrin repeat protein
MGGPEGKVLDSPESPILGAESDDEDYEDADYLDKQLEDILKKTSSGAVNLEEPDEADRFFDTYNDILDEADNTGYTLIHKIVEREDYYFEKQKPLLKLLLTKCPGILKKQDDEGQTALYTAIRKRKDSVVRFLCETAPIPATEALSVRSPNDNCLHQAIRKDASLAEYLLGKCNKKMLLERDDKRNTPLHVAVDYEICTDTHIRIVERLLELCEKALEEPGFDGLTPYRYHLQTKDRFEDYTSSTNKPQSWSRPATKGMAKLAKMKNAEINQGGNSENKPMSKLKVKKKLRPDGKKEVPKAKREEISKAIQRMLKLHCMRYLSRNATIDTLYGLYPSTFAAPKARNKSN